MRKWGKVIILLAGVVAGFVVFVFPRLGNEPTYQGKSLSEWVTRYTAMNGSIWMPMSIRGAPIAVYQKEIDAIRHIGTNALPSLLAWIDVSPTGWKYKVGGALRILPLWMRRSWLFGWLDAQGHAELRARNALFAFRVLGPIASPAIPELTRMLALTNSPAKRSRALYALACIGAEAMPEIMAVVSDPAQFPEQLAPWHIAIGDIGTNARPLVPVLLRNLGSSNAVVTGWSAVILGELKLEPEMVVPALAKGLASPDGDYRFVMTSALAEFGPLAKSAVPAVSNALHDPILAVRTVATNALLKIAPEALASAPPR